MYSLTIRDHFMVAHSFHGDVFGPAQQLHGATYVVDVTFSRPQLDADDVVVDIGRARQQLSAALADMRYRNLDEEPRFAGRNTTTEVLAHEIFERLAQAIRDGSLGEGGRGIAVVNVTLRESHIAWASFEDEV